MRLLLLISVLLVSVSAFGQAPAEPAVKIITPPSQSTIRARVFYEENGRPVRRTSVGFISSRRSGPEVTGLTDINGFVEIKNVRAGRYFAVVNSPGIVSPFAFFDFRPDEREFDEERIPFPPIIVDGISTIMVEVPARRGGAIGGRLTYADGFPAIGIKVEVLRKVGDEFLPVVPNLSVLSSMATMGAGMFQTDDRGMYRVAGLPPGEYIAKLTESVNHAPDRGGYRSSIDEMLFGSPSLISIFFPDQTEKENAQIINLAAGEELTEINMVVPDQNLRVLEGKVVAGKEKLPVRNAQLTISRIGSTTGYDSHPSTRGRLTTASNAKGEWKFVDLPKGRYTLSVEAPNSDYDEQDRAYGPDVNNEGGVVYPANANVTARKGSQPKFAKNTVEFLIADEDLVDQSIELKFGATIIGTVEMDDRGFLPTSISLAIQNDDGISGSESLYHYNYEGNPEPRPIKREFRIAGLEIGTAYFNADISEDVYYLKSVTSSKGELLGVPLSFSENEVMSGVRVVISKGTGTLSGSIADDNGQPAIGRKFMLIPIDPTKMRIANYSREIKTNENGEFSVKLPPFEFALIEMPERRAPKFNEEYWAKLSELVKKAQTFKIESGKTTKATIKSNRKTQQ